MAKPIEIEFAANFEKYMQNVLSAIEGSEYASNRISKSFDKVQNSVSNVAGVFGVGLGSTALLSFTKDAVMASAEYDNLRNAFKGTDEDLATLRKATAETVNDADLLKLSNQASDLGLSLEQQAILFALSEDAGDKYGVKLEEAFQKVVYASEGQVKGLKFLGIQKAEFEQIVNSLAKEEGAEIVKLDAETQKRIRLEAIMKASGATYDMVTGKIKDQKDELESISTSYDNFIVRTGKMISTYPKILYAIFKQGGIQGAMDALIAENVVNNSIKLISDRNNKAIEDGEANAIQQMKKKSEKQIKELYDNQKKYVDRISSNKNRNEDQEYEYKGAVAELNKYYEKLDWYKTNREKNKEKPIIKTDETLQKEINSIDVMLKGNVSLRERNELLAKRKKLEDELLDTKRILSEDSIVAALSINPMGVENIPGQKTPNTFHGKNYHPGESPLSKVNAEMGEGWKFAGDMAKRSTDMMAQGLSRALVYSEDLGQSLKNVGMTILESGLQFLISIGLKAGATSLGIPAFLFGNGGVVAEPVYGVGLNSKQSYMFGENGNEIVMPANRVGGVGGTVNHVVKIVGESITRSGDIYTSYRNASKTKEKFG